MEQSKSSQATTTRPDQTHQFPVLATGSTLKLWPKVCSCIRESVDTRFKFAQKRTVEEQKTKKGKNKVRELENDTSV